MDREQSLVSQLDKYRPDQKSCEEYALKERLEVAALTRIERGEFAGMTKIEAAANRILDITIENPAAPGAASLGDLVKLAAPRKQKTEVDAGAGWLNVFARFNDQAQEVIDPTEEII